MKEKIKNLIDLDSLENTLKWVRTALDFIALGAVLLVGLDELNAGRADLLRDTPFWSMYHWRMHHGMLSQFDYIFANASLYLILRIIGLA